VPEQASATGCAIVFVYVAHSSHRPETERAAGIPVSFVDEDLLRSALVDSEIDRDQCRVKPMGDRTLVLVPHGELTGNLVDVLPRRLAAATHSGDGMSLIIHDGESIEDSSAIDYASRLVDSLQKSARRPTGGLDVFVTKRAYQDTNRRSSVLRSSEPTYRRMAARSMPGCTTRISRAPRRGSTRAGIEQSVIKRSLPSVSIQMHSSPRTALRGRMTPEEAE
jgi:hypothetical protein